MADSDHTFRTKKGHIVHVRPIQRGDVPLLVDLFNHLGPMSRRQRFNRELDAPDEQDVWQEAERIARLSPSEAGGWLAFADLAGEGMVAVGVLRFIRIPPDTAEVAISVRDDLQNMGIGKQLLAILLKEGPELGFKKVAGLVRRDNEALWRLLKRTTIPVRRVAQGEYVYVEAEL